ncbi:hypothetical protein G6L37_07210 [Agrobacterium rubi]|nr:hypothetical protein [Agrobacterium rubi]NTF25155.1 hypothetical protein [Agrobacterium rubi]
MNLSQHARQMVGCIVAIVAIILFVVLLVGSGIHARLNAGSQGVSAFSAIAEICLKENGTWPCFERLDRWGADVIAGKVATPEVWRGPRSYREAQLGSLVQLVPVAEMFKSCPLTRKDECAARMIDFGYARSDTVSIASKE